MAQNYIGERFGDYKLVRPLGEGGFATVYLGEEVHKGTPAAVKLLREQQVHDFINEVRRTVLLRHPNIVEMLDFGIRTPDNTAFIIMEYAPNGSFRDKFPRDTRVPLNVVVSTVKQVASALQYAHDQRVIHRDVKPENLLLNARNTVLLSDFGIATASRTATVNAAQGDIIGTYAYMSPEQLKGRPVPASDQYSLGIMVYEWLCGELPFEGREYVQWHYLHQEVAPPALREHIPSLSPAVEQVVLRALAKKPLERFERVEMFALALEQASRGEDVSSVISMPGSMPRATQFDSAPIGNQANVFSQARLEQERMEQQRREQANLLKEKQDQERREREREQLAWERQEKERRERERLERERLAWEKQEQERLDLEKQEAEKIEKKRLDDKRDNRIMTIAIVVGLVVGAVGGIIGGAIIGGGTIGGFIGGVTGGRIIGGILGAIIGMVVEFVVGIFIEATAVLISPKAGVGGGEGFIMGLTVGGGTGLLLRGSVGSTIGWIAGVIVGAIVFLIVRSIIRSVK